MTDRWEIQGILIIIIKIKFSKHRIATPPPHSLRHLNTLQRIILAVLSSSCHACHLLPCYSNIIASNSLGSYAQINSVFHMLPWLQHYITTTKVEVKQPPEDYKLPCYSLLFQRLQEIIYIMTNSFLQIKKSADKRYKLKQQTRSVLYPITSLAMRND